MLQAALDHIELQRADRAQDQVAGAERAEQLSRAIRPAAREPYAGPLIESMTLAGS